MVTDEELEAIGENDVNILLVSLNNFLINFIFMIFFDLMIVFSCVVKYSTFWMKYLVFRTMVWFCDVLAIN